MDSSYEPIIVSVFYVPWGKFNIFEYGGMELGLLASWQWFLSQ